MKSSKLSILLIFSFTFILHAELRVHPMFSDNMVLQRDKPVRVWGTAKAGESIQVEFSGQSHSCEADADGTWAVELKPLPANTREQTLAIKGPSQSIEVKNVLVGDVWLCGGQSNMEFELAKIYHGDVEIASARHPAIRLMTVPFVSSPQRRASFQPLNEFNSWNRQYEQKGTWARCSPETVTKFASIGYVFARRLHLATGVPIGMIDNSVGGTTVEGWTSRASLGKIKDATPLLQQWDERIAEWDSKKDLAERVRRWENDTKRRKERGQKPRPKPMDLKPGPAFDRNNPGASYNAMLAPLTGFRLKGIIFHQGYNNALGDSRPKLYAQTLQAMITDWRAAFHDATLPFGIIELCAGADPQTMDNFELKMIDAGPFIREAQLKAYKDLENIGWACAYDQQVNWYHPQIKVQLGERIARWALATQYGLRIGHEPAMLVKHEVEEDRMVLSFDREVTVRDGRPIVGMAIAGEDQRFYPARAEFVVAKKDNRGRDVLDRRRVAVHSPFVSKPVAVRYAWARCPLGNLTNLSHMERILPVPSFRTDRWEGPDAPFGQDGGSSRRKRNEQRQQARANMKNRQIREAKRILESAKKD